MCVMVEMGIYNFLVSFDAIRYQRVRLDVGSAADDTLKVFLFC